MSGFTIAMPKGKLMDHALEMLRQSGLRLPDMDDSRKLLHTDPESGITLLVARSSDVPTFVEHGAADVGIVGKDTLLEEDKRVYELLDLGFGFCRFVVAAPGAKVEAARQQGADVLDYLKGRRSRLRVATKFPRLTERHFAKSGRPVEIIILKGSVELGPITGLADVIVDLVETGRTLRENGLVEVEQVATSTARLIGNGVAMRLKRERFDDLVGRLRAQMEVTSGAPAR